MCGAIKVCRKRIWDALPRHQQTSNAAVAVFVKVLCAKRRFVLMTSSFENILREKRQIK